MALEGLVVGVTEAGGADADEDVFVADGGDRSLAQGVWFVVLGSC